ncbi:MAG: DUF1553 domain-containing protein [Isosphaeraceae bacterium]
MTLRGLLAPTLVLCGGIAGSAPAAPNEPAGIEFFEKKIRPLLVERCYSCHSAQAKKVRGGLRLDTRAGWQAGGDMGPAIKPGDPEHSPLIEAVRYRGERLRMPPKGRLAEREVELLTRWVAMGAPDPRSGDAVGPPAPAAGPSRGLDRDLWSFRVPADPAVPTVADRAWPRSPLDHFVLEKLEESGLRPAPEADKRTLIRRATFDLIGLPPSTREVGAFLADRSPDAFAKVVERLLASPQYGERWGRHWLDVARYSDSNGLDENTAYGNAWRYRDHVIAAMNDDQPYDRFVLEQLAGDLLPRASARAETHRRLIATGFLSLGPKSLAEVDERKMVLDIVDEQIEAVGRTFMGLTLGCARCHDHKFDPISTADYYGLAGIFQSTRTMDSLKKLAKWHENSLGTEQELARLAEHERKVKEQRDSIDQLVREANERVKAAGGKGFELPAKPEELYPAESKARLQQMRDALAKLEKEAPEVPSALGVEEGAVVEGRILVRGNHLTPGAPVARRFPHVLAMVTAPPIGKDRSGRLELARWLVDDRHPLTARVMVNRIWRWHFGQGLVATPDNFGTTGERPVHPELLDWLARRFIEGGWSIKAMHRLIMLSSTYRQSAAYDPEASQVDPEGRLYWRWPPRRLEAEAVRDFLLAVGEALDLGRGGPVLHVKNREYLFDHTSIDKTRYDSRRRAVYLPVIRNNVHDVFQLFDFADPTVPVGHRATTTVALQALFMMNGELIYDMAERIAGRLLRRATCDAGRIRDLFETAYGRPPTAAETTQALEFVERYSQATAADEDCDLRRRLLAWQAYCQVVLCSNEFISIR